MPQPPSRRDENPAPDPRERLSGAIERVTFHSEESGFCVLRVKVKGHRDPVTVIGSAATVTPGEFIEAFGAWVNDRNHGLQFKADILKTVPPTALEGSPARLGGRVGSNRRACLHDGQEWIDDHQSNEALSVL